MAALLRDRQNTRMFLQLLKDFLGKPAGERIDVAEADAKALVAQQIRCPFRAPFKGLSALAVEARR